MSPRNVLVIALEAADERLVRERVLAEDADTNVHVIAPASNLSALEWLTNDEDEARAEAERVAERVSGAVEQRVEAEVGDTDPLFAIEDALRSFRADEIVVVGGPEGRVTAEELSRFGLPVRRLAFAREGGDGEPAEGIAREVAEGRTTRTPLVLLGSVAATVWAVAALIAGIVFLFAWLL